MSTDGSPLDLVRGERTITRPPKFGGGEFVEVEGFDVISEANEYVTSLIRGYADAFLADAWYQISVVRRRVKGKFATNPAWLVYVYCRRPRPGEIYEAGQYPDVGLVMEYL